MKMRNKLMAASLMLVVSILMMSTASFAWFTISTAPEVKGMTTNVAVNENLEIALATSTKVPDDPDFNQSGLNQSSWGNLVDLEAADANYASLASKELRPAQLNSANTGFVTPTYRADGRINTTSSTAALQEETAHPFGNLTNNNDIYGYYVDVWLRTNVAGDITLVDDGEGVDRGSDLADGDGAYLEVTETERNATVTKQMFADCIRVGCRILGESKIDSYSTEEGVKYTYAEKAGATIVEFDKTADGANKYRMTGMVVENAEADVAYLVRIYVWLDGVKMTNVGAATDEFNIGGKINLQFQHSETLNSMPNAQ